MYSVTIGFRNGSEFAFVCQNCTVKRSAINGKVTDIEFKEADKTTPLYVDLDEVLFVYAKKEDKGGEV